MGGARADEECLSANFSDKQDIHNRMLLSWSEKISLLTLSFEVLQQTLNCRQMILANR